MTKSLCVLIVAALLTACARLHAATHPGERWIGHDESELVSALGAPDRTASLGNGGRVLTWVRPTDGTTPDATVPGGQRHYRSECRSTYTVSPQGKVTAWTHTGDC